MGVEVAQRAQTDCWTCDVLLIAIRHATDSLDRAMLRVRKLSVAERSDESLNVVREATSLLDKCRQIRAEVERHKALHSVAQKLTN
jgi:hypothetical protein